MEHSPKYEIRTNLPKGVSSKDLEALRPFILDLLLPGAWEENLNGTKDPESITVVAYAISEGIYLGYEENGNSFPIGNPPMFFSWDVLQDCAVAAAPVQPDPVFEAILQGAMV